MQKVLKVTAEEWKSVAEFCEIPALSLRRQAAHVAALDLIGALWDKDAFHRAHQSADEIAILAKQGEGRSEFVLRQKYYNKIPRGKRLEIVIGARFLRSRHKFCLRLALRWTEISPWGLSCECGCGLTSSEMKNPAQPQCRQAQVSPITLLRDLGLIDARAAEANIAIQAKLVQYFMQDKHGKIKYVDFFDHFTEPGAFALECFDSWVLAFVHATKRHKTCSGKARDAYYKKIIRNVRDKVTATGMRRGTVYVAYKKLLQAKASMLWATYNVKECYKDNVQLFATEFAEFTVHPSVNARSDRHRRSMIKVRQANKTGEFHAIKWRDITLFDLVHLIATESSTNAPPIESLHSAISGCGGDGGAMAPELTSEPIFLMERVLSHRLCWLHQAFECEWASSPSWSLTGMSYSAVMHAVHGDARQVGLEQFGHAYSTILHTHNQGGLMLSNAPSLASGDALGPVHRPAKALVTYDYSLHYPSSLKLGLSSSHFVRGYHRVLARKGESAAADHDVGTLVSLDPQKNHFFEYLNSYYVIAQFLARDGKDIALKKVYTLYNSNGQIRVGGAGLDLLVVYTKIDKWKREGLQRHWAAFNMHHQ
jgi:hypothetical protein